MRHDRHAAELLEAEEHVSPVSGNRRYFSGFYDRAAKHGAITGSGPNFEAAMSAFEERMRQRGLPGIWRNGQYPNNGTQRDVPYYINEWI